MLKLYNGKEINVKNVLELLQEPEESGGHMTQSRMQYMWRNFKSCLDSCEDGLCLYTLRHTFCTDLQDAGISLTVAAKLMGHSNPALTAKVYTHQTDRTFADAKKKLEKYRQPQESF